MRGVVQFRNRRILPQSMAALASPNGLSSTLSRNIGTKPLSATNAAIRRTNTLARHTNIALNSNNNSLSSSSSSPATISTSTFHSSTAKDSNTNSTTTTSTTEENDARNFTSSSTTLTSGTTINTPPSSDKATSFIDRVKAYGVQAMLGKLVTSERFDRVLKDLIVTSINITEGTVECELLINEDIQNTYGTLHGGAIATIVDVVGTMAILTKDPLRAGVSIDLNVTYIAAAKANENIKIIGKVLKTGKRLAFSEVSFYRSKDNTLLATGRHTKAL